LKGRFEGKMRRKVFKGRFEGKVCRKGLAAATAVAPLPPGKVPNYNSEIAIASLSKPPFQKLTFKTSQLKKKAKRIAFKTSLSKPPFQKLTFKTSRL